ncbi:hypothetical protein BpHYR1_022911 [Brachionus plicatilis]|uniref:Uncharacterized protein n=1 Tax=Brachionus plicatilis TaxID=10195 RepID=A0A3M7T611_BRAPC|nr:hypothetical protein BpHYR1_022911 [Brachionus plicatilis]
MNENVNYVTKDINPPNVLQVRSTENFWGCLSEKEFDLNFVKSLMVRVKAKLRKIGHGEIFAFNFCQFTYASPHQNFKLLEAPKRSFLRPYKISMKVILIFNAEKKLCSKKKLTFILAAKNQALNFTYCSGISSRLIVGLWIGVACS